MLQLSGPAVANPSGVIGIVGLTALPEWLVKVSVFAAEGTFTPSLTKASLVGLNKNVVVPVPDSATGKVVVPTITFNVLEYAGASVFIEKSRLLDKPQGLLDTGEQVLKARSVVPVRREMSPSA